MTTITPSLRDLIEACPSRFAIRLDGPWSDKTVVGTAIKAGDDGKVEVAFDEPQAVIGLDGRWKAVTQCIVPVNRILLEVPLAIPIGGC